MNSQDLNHSGKDLIMNNLLSDINNFLIYFKDQETGT